VEAKDLDFSELEPLRLAAPSRTPDVEVLATRMKMDSGALLFPEHVGQDRFVTLGAQCTAEACVVKLVLADVDAKLLTQIVLVEQDVYTGADVSASSVALVELFASGSPVVLAEYERCGEPQPAVGPQCERYRALFDVERGVLLWHERVSASGAGGLQDCSSTMKASVGEKGVVLSLSMDCWDAICRDDPSYCTDAPSKTERTWRWDEGAREFKPGGQPSTGK
jgi:hypothetical protein